jgi:HAD superfamily hydrolase (TIGR01509 family)
VEAPAGIGFDIDHTLAIDNRLERVAFLRLLELLLNEGGRSVGTLADEIDAIDALLAQQRSGAFSIDAAVELFTTAHGVAVNAAYARYFRDRALEMVDEFVVPLPGARMALDSLHERGIALAVLSNGWNPLQVRKAERVGFRGPVIASADIGVQKPALRAFDAMLERLGMPASRTWYVGDDPQGDIAGADAAGIATVWLDWEKKTYPADTPLPTHTIHTFGQLLDIALPAERAS